mgnify:FL=1
MPPWSLYILRCADGTLYTGITTDVEKRVKAHNAGKGAKYTRGRGPVTLVFVEEEESESAARVREAEIKRMTREEKERLVHHVKID